MNFGNLRRKPNLLLIVTDQEREVIWKYAVYYDPFTASPTECEMYDLKRDPLEMRNLAHRTHSTPASDAERTRLHRRLTEVMRVNSTIPDEIRWPGVDDV